MNWWVFHEEALDSELAKREVARMKDGATEQQAKDETSLIKLFLVAGLPKLGGKR